MVHPVQEYHCRGDIQSEKIVSSIRAELRGGHVDIHIWNRGAKAGVLTVGVLDASYFIDLLLPPFHRVEVKHD